MSSNAKSQACETCKDKDTVACGSCGEKVNTAYDQETLKIDEALSRIKHKIAIVSGKGGVGKSTVTAALALSLAQKGYRIGVLDADVSGPNMPHLLGVEGVKMTGSESGFSPVLSQYEIKLASIESVLGSSDDPVIWKGPMRTSVIRQFLAEMLWGELDYLLVDLPPGTGDEPLSIMQMVPLDGVIIVTTPSSLSILDVSKIINMARMLKVRILGIVENMAYLKCPDCSKEIYPFGKDTVKKLADKYGLDILGSIPLDQENNGADVLTDRADGEIMRRSNEIAQSVISNIP